jgi:hypothetical protein
MPVSVSVSCTQSGEDHVVVVVVVGGGGGGGGGGGVDGGGGDVDAVIIIIKNKKEKTCTLINVAISADRNVVQKEAEKNLKYKILGTEIQ